MLFFNTIIQESNVRVVIFSFLTTSMSIELKISILDGGTIDLTMQENSKLSDLRSAIKNQTGIEEDKQRLIYLGRVLREDKLLTEYNIHSGVCIQLVKAPVLP